MIKLKTPKNERLMSDGNYLTNGDWIVNLSKIPLGELLKEKIDIIAVGNQLVLFEDDVIRGRDFTTVIPSDWDYELANTGIVYENPTSKVKYQLFADKSSGMCTWVKQDYLKLFNDIKTIEVVANKGLKSGLQFLDADHELVFMIMPVELDQVMADIHELSIKYSDIKAKSKLLEGVN